MTDNDLIHPAALGDWSVSCCACGHIVLKIGATEMQFGRAEFARLHHLVSEATREFEIAPRHGAVVELPATTATRH